MQNMVSDMRVNLSTITQARAIVELKEWMRQMEERLEEMEKWKERVEKDKHNDL